MSKPDPHHAEIASQNGGQLACPDMEIHLSWRACDCRYVEGKMYDQASGLWSFRNWGFRTAFRSAYIICITFVGKLYILRNKGLGLKQECYTHPAWLCNIRWALDVGKDPFLMKLSWSSCVSAACMVRLLDVCAFRIRDPVSKWISCRHFLRLVVLYSNCYWPWKRIPNLTSFLLGQ